MKGDTRLIEGLNEILTAELTAVNQYFIHAMIYKKWGYEGLAEKIRGESIEEMKHAEVLIERILHLEGIPNLSRIDKIKVGDKITDHLRSDLEVENTAIPRLNRMIALAVEIGDNGTRQLLEQILLSEEEHQQWLEGQLELVRQVGEANYLAQQIRKPAS